MTRLLPTLNTNGTATIEVKFFLVAYSLFRTWRSSDYIGIDQLPNLSFCDMMNIEVFTQKTEPRKHCPKLRTPRRETKIRIMESVYPRKHGEKCLKPVGDIGKTRNHLTD